MSVLTSTPNKLASLVQSIETNKDLYTGKIIWVVRVSIPLSEGPVQLQPEKVNSLIRALTNGKQVMGGQDNRTWCKQNFYGMCYTVRSHQPQPEMAPSAQYTICFIGKDSSNLKPLQMELTRRIEKILPGCTVEVMEQKKIETTPDLTGAISFVGNVQNSLHLHSGGFTHLNPLLQQWLLSILCSSIRCAGEMFRQI